MGHDQSGRDQQRAPPESAPHADRRTEAREQQPREEGIQQTREADVDLFRGDAPAADDGVGRRAVGGKQAEQVEIQREVQRQHRGPGHEQPQHEFREAPDDEGIEDIGDVFVEQRPCGAVQRAGLAPAADVPRRQRGQHRTAQQADQQHLPPLYSGDHREGRGPEVEEQRADERPHDDHRMQAHQAALEEVLEGHAVPAVVVGIADHEAREHEKEIDGQVAVVENLVGRTFGVGFQQVEGHHDHRRHAAQSVEDFVAGFRGQVTGCSRRHRVRMGFVTPRRCGSKGSCRPGGCRRSRPALRPPARNRCGGRRDAGCSRGCGR